MRILIIGSGGREHALAWKAAQSDQVKKVWVAPGNAGTFFENKIQNVSIDSYNILALINFAKTNRIDLTIIGPEVPLALGIVDQFRQENLRIFGPTQVAANLEASKSFCKKFLYRHNIPTANFVTFTEQRDALSYLSNQSFPVVIKVSGLAAGKGVFVVQSLTEAQDVIVSIMEKKKFGSAGQEIIIEEFLYGEELSFTVVVDGEHILPLAGSQDHKRLLNGDLGPNTGGMGTYSPVPFLSCILQEKIVNEIVNPTILALRAEGISYQGFLYVGLMIIPENTPKVLEFNVRLGDPETQTLMMRLQSDLIELVLSAVSGGLDKINVVWDPRSALTVVMTSKNYPENNDTQDDIIEGLHRVLTPDAKIFHAGTKKRNGFTVTSGGRVLSITALGFSLKEAQKRAYQIVNQISWPNCHYRNDIGYRAISN
ncbi:phosphoribosylamine--glycine ligase [Coxiella endosymbiont of Amblyomma sculptum]|uniref:phosphoribosylamine--glycine ligase n=1 Tax=Coxiella endosymbiont of Amblyomma sculptum TaxID=2487929 RepID=UPI00132F2DA8|nr:phosphoribosylamine--glycine ligase [Coxiella endosymbiont of Amblyomma sculptum]QHG92480.1 phosphoribosylamine--glycine ligase [Coxiella endosymbiont of Amblyomma sculptum]